MSDAEKTLKWTLSIGEVAHRTGLARSALHYYEERGLISSFRTAGNQRRYRRDVIRRVSLIKVAQRLGVSLEEIREALCRLPDNRPANQDDWQRLARQWGQSLDRRIHQLQALRKQLTGCIGCGCLSTDRCPLRNPWDELAALGPGPHLL